MQLNERVLVFQDNQDNPIAIRNRITPQVGDRVVVHETDEGKLITHGKDRFQLGDRVLVFDGDDNPVMIRIGAEQPIPTIYDWLDETMQGWEETGSSDHSWVNLDYSSVLDRITMTAYHYADYPSAIAEVESDWCYGTWTMRFYITTRWYYGQIVIARYYFIMNGLDYYYVEINTSANTIALYNNTTLLDVADYDNQGDMVHTLEIVRDWNGYFNISVDGVEYLNALDNSITSSEKQQILFDSNSFGKYWFFDYIQFDELV